MIQCPVIRRCMRKRNITDVYIRLVQDMYKGATTWVNSKRGIIEHFAVWIGLHQRSALSLFLLCIVLRREPRRNDGIRPILHLSPIDEVMHSGRLRWFRHIQRRDDNNVTRTVTVDLAIPWTRRRGRPNKTLHQQIEDDMMVVGVTHDMALDRKQWRRRTRPTPRI